MAVPTVRRVSIAVAVRTLLIAATIIGAAVARRSLPAGAEFTPTIGAPVRLVVPSIGIDAPVAAFGLNADLTMPVPQEAGLVAWYTCSTAAGTPGNAVLAGHRDWNRQRGVFSSLDSVRDGDEVWLQDGPGAWYLYRVVWTTSLPDDRAPIAEIAGPTEHSSVTLITCSGTFSRDAGAYLERRIVRADLIATYPPE